MEQRHLLLFGYCSLSELHQHVRIYCTDSEAARLPEIVAAWRASQQVQAARHAASKASGEAPIGPAVAADLVTSLERPLSRSYPHLPTTVEWVSIDELVSPQRVIWLDATTRLRAPAGKAYSEKELVDICLSISNTAGVQHFENASHNHVFSSAHADLRYLGTQVMPLHPGQVTFNTTGDARYAVVSLVGFGNPLMSVWKVKDRVVLHNGFHRAYALRLAGVKKIPVVVQHAQHPRELPSQIFGVSRDYLLQSATPPRLADFFDLRLICELAGKPRQKVISIQPTVNQMDVPR
jgi:hypothetical protein